ncbi:signal transduction histidine kinase [Natranaerovirga hydrolytica]|uniref:histidine kinase n=1 Tax=Natranaerovirga hydrolytica TaxID=680378 RepID=A0A4R1MY76_9FIRM|nr:sensor histidine kinase [Natranaerovirga hydrolytica]TCK98166.1 signal transduction histidine kinase [Natranaerovirga hydrolytica]
MDINSKDDTKNTTTEAEEVKKEMTQSNLEDTNASIDEDLESPVQKASNNKPNKDKKIAYNFITFIMLLILAILSVLSFSEFREQYYDTEGDIKNYITSHYFSNDLALFNNYLYRTKVLDEQYWNQYENVESINYIITNESGSIYHTNADDPNEMMEGLDESVFYLKITFDEKGEILLDTPHNTLMDKYLFSHYHSNLMTAESIANEEVIDESQNDALFDEDDFNITITYRLADNFETYDDIFVQSMKSMSINNSLIHLILIIAIISIIILITIAFSVPYSIQKRTLICDVFNKTFLEIKGFILLGWFILLFLGGVLINDFYFRNGSIFVNIIYNQDMYFYTLGFMITFVIFLLIYLCIVYLKYIYYNGFVNAVIKNSLIIRLFMWLYKIITEPIKQILAIDITKEYQSKLIGIAVVNIILLWLMFVSRSILTFFIVIAYSVFLLKYLLKFLNELKSLYNASSQLAEGDFDITLEEEGLLEPIDKNLNNIKESFQLAVDKEIKSQRMKAELISNVSHDLKTPLTSIITYVDLLKEKNLTEQDQEKYVEILEKKSKRLKILIEDLFEASKASTGTIELNTEKLDVVALFRQTIGELEEIIKDSELTFKMNLPEDKVFCQLDGQRTYRIFENIMSNIFKYSLKNSRVYIDVIDEEQNITFIFKNISAYEMNFDAKEIIERFVRGDESRNQEGSGLGLSIAKSLVELQNGTLDINIDGDLFKIIISFAKV